MRRLLALLARPIVAAHRRKVNRQAGMALVVVTVTVAMMGAIVGEFGYNARVEMESAANARDQLRAEYLARSGIHLTRLLIKLQQGVLDRLNNDLKMDIQIAEFAPFLMKAFGGSDGAEELGGLLGINAGKIKGLGVGKGASFDVVMGVEDGKININCGGGLNAGGGGALPLPPALVTGQPAANAGPAVGTPPQRLYALLTALMFSPRYNRLFDNPDADGQYATRDLIARAVIDWSDIDETRYEESGASGNAEDYRYDSLRDPYRAHNNYFDTVEELHLVQGVGDDFWGSFGEMFTVYGKCQVNLRAVKAEHWPITAAIIRIAAKDRQNPVLYDDALLAGLAQQISTMAQMLGGLQNVNQFGDMSKNGGMPNLPPLGGANAAQSQQQAQLQPILPGLQPVELRNDVLQQLAVVGPRRIYRLDSTGTVARAGSKRIQVHIRAVWDSDHFNQNTTSGDVNDRQGTWVYWRMD